MSLSWSAVPCKRMVTGVCPWAGLRMKEEKAKQMKCLALHLPSMELGLGGLPCRVAFHIHLLRAVGGEWKRASPCMLSGCGEESCTAVAGGAQSRGSPRGADFSVAGSSHTPVGPAPDLSLVMFSPESQGVLSWQK